MSPEEQHGLVAQARDLVAQAAAAIGFEDPGNSGREKTCAPMQDRLASAIADSGDPRAARALGEAQALWWQLANTATSLVGETVKPYTNTPIPIEDLRQVGKVGLYEAARRYRTDQGTSFRTHARWWVRAAVYRELKRDRVVHSPHGLLVVASLDAPLGTSDDRTLGELMPAAADPGPEQLALTGEREALARYALGRLREMDRRLLSGSHEPGLCRKRLWWLRRRAQARAIAELQAVGITEAA